jgi:hypothetical protein
MTTAIDTDSDTRMVAMPNALDSSTPASAVFCISDPTIPADRDGDWVNTEGLHFDNYKKAGAPVFFDHQKNPYPIGSSIDPDTGKLDIWTDSKGRLLARVHFDMHDPTAKFIAGKVHRGFLKGASVAFLPISASPKSERSNLMPRQGHNFMEADVTEWSICGIGSNPNAVLADAPEAVRKQLYPGWPPYERLTMRDRLRAKVNRFWIACTVNRLYEHCKSTGMPYHQTPESLHERHRDKVEDMDKVDKDMLMADIPDVAIPRDLPDVESTTGDAKEDQDEKNTARKAHLEEMLRRGHAMRRDIGKQLLELGEDEGLRSRLMKQSSDLRRECEKIVADLDKCCGVREKGNATAEINARYDEPGPYHTAPPMDDGDDWTQEELDELLERYRRPQ